MTSAVASQPHDLIKQALAPLRGQQITYDQWEATVRQIPGLGSKGKFEHPSDHCSNMSNKQACSCARTNQALVERVQKGGKVTYLVL